MRDSHPPTVLLMTRTIPATALCLIVTASSPVASASADTNWSGGNQLEYSLASEGGLEILEDWFDLEWSSGDLAAGVRYEIFQPHEDRPDSVTEGLVFKYLRYEGSNVRLTAGNFYALLGHGLALRSYEDRGTRRDSNLEGVKLDLTTGPAEMTLLSGRARNGTGERNDLLHGLDVELSPLDFLRLGLSYLSNRNPDAPHARPNELATFRTNISAGPIDLRAEHGRRRGPSQYSLDGDQKGRAFYMAAGLASGPAGITVEYKDYKDFKYLMSDRVTEYNLPPAVIREYGFTLLNRHPHTLDHDDEKGAQVELLASAGAGGDLLFSVGKTDNQEGKLQFQESYVRWDHAREAGHTTGALHRSKTSDQELTTLIGEEVFYFGDSRSLKTQVQHQHVSGHAIGAYDDDLLLLEFSPNPDLTLAISAERTNKSDLQRSQGEKTRWVHGIVTRNIGANHYVSLMYGNRQAGFICAGGVCRFEPEFDGLEFKMFSTF